MHNNDFEKQVQQMMDELKITPSASVWQQVEIGIEKEKKKRRVFFLLPVLCILGIATWFALSISDKDSVVQQKSVENEKPAIALDDKLFIKTDAIVKNDHTVKKQDQYETVEYAEINRNESSQQSELVSLSSKQTVSIDAVNDNSEKETAEENIYASAVPVNLHTQASLSEGDSLIEPHTTEIKHADTTLSFVKDRKHTGWEYGIQVATGTSGISYNGFGLFSSGFTYDDMYYSTSSSGSSINNGGGAVIASPSEIRNGASYAIGLLTRKYLGERTSICLGVNYQYLSTQISVGSFVDNSISVNTGNSFNKNVSDYYLTTPSNSHNYTNQFHYISFPVAYDMQLLHKLPLNLSMGLSPGLLVSSNVLHYDRQQGVYYHDKRLLNKVSLNLMTNLTYRLWQSKSVALQAGPYIHYGASRLLKREISEKSSHLYSAGLSVQLFLIKR